MPCQFLCPMGNCRRSGEFWIRGCVQSLNDAVVWDFSWSLGFQCEFLILLAVLYFGGSFRFPVQFGIPGISFGFLVQFWIHVMVLDSGASFGLLSQFWISVVV